MKKFLITLLILIIAGGVVFYFGWVQIQIPPEGYAVFFSKTHGYDENIILPGEFVWKWQRLIPTNVTLHVFSPEIQETTVSVKGELASGSFYAQYLQGSPDFSWEVEIYLRYTLKPESLPRLVRDEHVTSDSLQDYYKTLHKKVEGYIYPQVHESLTNTNFADLEENLTVSLSQSFPTIEFIDVYVVQAALPDMKLYEEGKNYYLEMVDLENKLKQAETEKTTVEDLKKNLSLNVLREYGEILSDYPVLMEYLELKGSFTDLTIPETPE